MLPMITKVHSSRSTWWKIPRGCVGSCCCSSGVGPRGFYPFCSSFRMRVSAAHRLRERTFRSSYISDPAAHARPDEAAPPLPQPTTSCWLRHVSGSAYPRIWYSSLADLTTRIDPYSVVIGSARRSEFQSKLACPLEGLRRITRRERHGSGYV